MEDGRVGTAFMEGRFPVRVEDEEVVRVEAWRKKTCRRQVG